MPADKSSLDIGGQGRADMPAVSSGWGGNIALEADPISVTWVTDEEGNAIASDGTHMVDVTYVEKPAGDDVVGIRPNPKRVREEAQHHANQRWSLTLPEVGGDVRVCSSRSLLSERAGTTESEEGESKETQFKSWVRLEVKRVPALIESADTDTPAAGADYSALMARAEQPFSVITQATAIPAERQDAIERKVLDRATLDVISARKEWENPNVDALQRRRQRVAGNLGALVCAEVVVGAETDEAAAELARAVATSVLPVNEGARWYVPEGADGKPAIHRSAEAALKASSINTDAYMPADEFVPLVELPIKELPGISMGEAYDFSVNRVIAPGQEVLQGGWIMDTEGKLGEASKRPFPIPVDDLMEHFLAIGSSGSGKTVELRELIRNIMSYSHERFEANGTEPVKVVVLDGKKIGNYTQILMDQLAALELPDSYCTASVVRPGSPGVRPTLDIFNPEGSTLAEQISDAVNYMTIDISSVGDSERMLRRYIADGIRAAYTLLGWNITTNGSEYAKDTPAQPTWALVEACIRQSLADSDYDPKRQGNIGEFSAGHVNSILASVAGQFFQNGSPIDFRKVLNDPGLTVFELLGISDKSLRNIAVSAIFRELIKSLDMEDAAKGLEPGERDHLRLVVVIDEAGGIFNNSDSGAENAELLTHLRSRGVSIVIGMQDNLDELNKDARANIHNISAKHIGEPSDRALLEEMTGQGQGSLRYLTSRHAKDGRGVAYGNGMDKPVPTVSTYPVPTKKGAGHVKDARHLVDKGIHTRPYDGETLTRAADFLVSHQLGGEIRAWAELNAMLVAARRVPTDGGLPVKMSEGMRQTLRNMKNPDLVKAAIGMAVEDAVDSRPQIMHAMKRQSLKNLIAPRMRADFENTKAEALTLPQDEALISGHYGPLANALDDILEGKPVDTTAYEPILGRIEATTAKLQLDELVVKRRDDLMLLHKVVAADAHQATVSPETRQKAKAAAARLLGGSSAERAAYYKDVLKRRYGESISEQELAATEQADNTEIVCTLLEAQIRRRLTEAEKQAATTLVGASKPGPVGYATVWKKVDAVVDSAAKRTDFDIDTWQKRYGEEFLGNTVADLAKTVKEKADFKIKTSPYEEVDEAMLFAPDLRKGGHTIDTIVAGRLSSVARRSSIRKAQDAANHGGKPESYSLIDMIAKGGDAWQVWNGALSKYVLNNSHFQMSGGTRRYILEHFRQAILELRAIPRPEKKQLKEAA